MLLREKNYVSVTLKLLENISSKKKLCVIEEEIMFQSIKKKIYFVHVFNISLGMGQYSLIPPPLSEFFLPTFVSFDSKCNICQSPKLTSSFDPPPQQIGAISLYRSNLYQKVNVYVIGSLYHATSKKPIALGFSGLREKNSTGALQTPN